MIVRQFSLETIPNYTFDQEFDLNRIAFFDIETTGFAAESTYLYLIGCAYYKESSFHLIQWFSENYQEEARIISSFIEFLENYDVLIHYNGTGFDIPYLMRKCTLLKLDYSFDRLVSIDIYKKIFPYKRIFKIPNFRQKSLEVFLNIHRRDIFDGGDLIQVYQSYIGKKHIETLKKLRTPSDRLSSPSEAELLLGQLLLHNEDDIRGLISILPILNISDLFEKPIRIQQAGVEGDIFTIHFETTAKLPVRVSYGNDLAHLTAFDRNATLTIRIYEGELKHFYDNYKDYYYLPAEDCAIHKSLALFVDKEYRAKAKPSNCYTKKQGAFVPQYEPVLSPYFKNTHKDKLSFLEIHTDFLLQEEHLEQYVQHILSNLFR